MALEISVKYRGFVRHSDATGNFLSWCPLLDIKSQGRTIEEARASLDDSVRAFVVHCFRRGILEEVLKRRGLEECTPRLGGNGADDSGEHVSVRPVAAATDGLLDSWEGNVPLHLVASAHTKPAGIAWQQ